MPETTLLLNCHTLPTVVGLLNKLTLDPNIFSLLVYSSLAYVAVSTAFVFKISSKVSEVYLKYEL